MVTSNEVFAKRREGALEDAYQMALELMQKPAVDDWDRRALAWCCIDLIKRDVKSGDSSKIEDYRQHLEGINAAGDDILGGQIIYALSLTTRSGQEVARAKDLSKAGKPLEAARIYRKLIAEGTADTDVHTALAWETYKHSKMLLSESKENADRVKPVLKEYLRLKAERPSLIHSCMLQLAAGLAANDMLNMAVFARLWGLENLRPEDYQRFQTDEGKSLPSLAEKVLMQAGKSAAKTEGFDWTYLVPQLEAAIPKFPDNKWLKLRYANALRATERHDDALKFALQIAKSVPSEYWAWELLGDISATTSVDGALSCYAKALSCSPEEKFVGKLRLKFASLLVEVGELAKAKYEVHTVIAFRQKEGLRIPDAASEIASTSWYEGTEAVASGTKAYLARAKKAESLLFEGLEWINGNVGGTYADPKKEGKVRRRLFVQDAPEAFEVSIPGSKFDLRGLSEGDGIRVKGEFDADKRFHVYLVEKRDDAIRWDALPEKVAVVDHVNNEKKVVHFLFDRGSDGLVAFSQLTKPLEEGDAIAVRRVRVLGKDNLRTRIVSAAKTDQMPSASVRKAFEEAVRIQSGMGFTESDIFIPPPLVSRHSVQHGDILTGIAVMSFNKKRSTWGWKAVSLHAK